jgi:hypothetical protein
MNPALPAAPAAPSSSSAPNAGGSTSVNNPPPGGGAAAKPAAPAAPTQGNPTPPVDPNAEELKQLDTLLKKHAPKVKAKDREVALDTLDKIKHYSSKGFGAERFIEEGKKQSYEAQQILKLKEQLNSDDPREQLAAIKSLAGPKAAKVAENLLFEEMQREEKYKDVDPATRELLQRSERLEQEVRSLQQEKQQRLEAEKQLKEQELVKQLRQDVLDTSKKVIELMKASDELAPSLLPRVARYMRINNQLEVPLDAGGIAAAIQDDIRGEFLHLSSTMDGNGLLDLFGEKAAASISRAWLQRARMPQGETAP